jgi:hypothetical protein
MNENPRTLVEDKADINTMESTKSGFEAVIENAFRRFSNLGFIIFLLPIAAVYIFCIAFALTPGIMLFQWASEITVNYPFVLKAFCYGLCGGGAFVGFIFGIVFIVPIMNLPCLPFVKSYRGPWFSLESLPWFYHNALTYLVRYSILDFVTPSPINIYFFKAMGMKIGKGVMINSSNISDPCLIRLEDHVTIGGSAYLMAHYGMKGFLIIDKLVIKKGAMLGLASKVLGGVTIGERAVVAPNVAVLPKTIIKDGEKFGIIVTSNTST